MNTLLMVQQKKEEEDASETVGKVKDIDGSDILITINEDSDKDEESSSQVGTIDIPISSVQQMPRVTSTVKDDVVIVDLSDDKPPPPVKPKPPVVPINQEWLLLDQMDNIMFSM